MGTGPRSHRWLRAGERLGLALGLVCLAWVGYVKVEAALYDREQRAVLAQERRAAVAATRTASEAVPNPEPSFATGDVIGLLDIPRLGFSEIVAEGDDDHTLRLAIGHLPDTPLPWQPGNSAFAGHRDGRFRPLAGVKIGDRVRLTTSRGDFDYVLRKTMIVLPSDVWVLKPTDTRTLTLITCYPFSYVGSAPQRFVMVAEAAN